jgi:hypothetical protein
MVRQEERRHLRPGLKGIPLVDDSPPHHPEDDHDDLAALDFSAPDVGSSASVLDALGEYAKDDSVDDDSAAADVLEAIDPRHEDAEVDELPAPLFTVTNPPGTVTVTTFMDGRVNRVDLSPKVTTMTETNLADEIVVMAGLATQAARSAQYSFSTPRTRRSRPERRQQPSTATRYCLAMPGPCRPTRHVPMRHPAPCPWLHRRRRRPSRLHRRHARPRSPAR